jgi:hypothetical protein
MKMEDNYIGLLNELEIMKINENIQKDINFIELRKKISKLKNMMLLKNNKYDSRKKSSNSLNNIHEIKENGEYSKEAVILFKCKLCTEKSNISKRMSKEKINKVKHNISNRIYKDKDRNRLLFKKDNLYDSFHDEDYINEQIGYYIKLNSWLIKIFDTSLFLSSMIYFIYVPYLLSQNYFINKENDISQIILIMIDIIYNNRFHFKFFQGIYKL